MTKTFKRRIRTVKQGNSIYVSVPLAIRELLDIEQGDKFIVTVDGDNIIYTKVKEG